MALLVMLALSACGVRPPTAGPTPPASEPPSAQTPPPVQVPPSAEPVRVGPTPGSRAPAVAGVEIATLEQYGLGQLRGKIVLLNFFAAWCIPCRTEMPMMQEMADELADQMAVVAVGADVAEVPELLRQFTESLGVTFPVLYDEGEAARRYRVLGLPATFFIDPDGYVRSRIEGPLTEKMIREQVEKLSSS